LIRLHAPTKQFHHFFDRVRWRPLERSEHVCDQYVDSRSRAVRRHSIDQSRRHRFHQWKWLQFRSIQRASILWNNRPSEQLTDNRPVCFPPVEHRREQPGISLRMGKWRPGEYGSRHLARCRFNDNDQHDHNDRANNDHHDCGTRSPGSRSGGPRHPLAGRDHGSAGFTGSLSTQLISLVESRRATTKISGE
jgi:hypothetical protein